MKRAVFLTLAVGVGCTLLWGVAEITWSAFASPAITALAMLGTAVAYAWYGRSLRKLVRDVVYLGGVLAITRRNKTVRRFDATTRGSSLTPILRTFLDKTSPRHSNIYAIGHEFLPDAHGTCEWTRFLNDASARGVQVSVLLPDTDPVRDHKTLLELETQDKTLSCFRLLPGRGRQNAVIRTVCAWSSHPPEHQSTILWIEGRRNAKERTNAYLFTWRELKDEQELIEVCMKDFLAQRLDALTTNVQEELKNLRDNANS